MALLVPMGPVVPPSGDRGRPRGSPLGRALAAALVVHGVVLTAVGLVPREAVRTEALGTPPGALRWEPFIPLELPPRLRPPIPGARPAATLPARVPPPAASPKERRKTPPLLASRASLPPPPDALVAPPRPPPEPGPSSRERPAPRGPDPLDMRRPGPPGAGPTRPRPAPRRRLDLSYRPAAGELAMPRPVAENRQRGDDGSREPPLRDRVIRPRRAARGIFRLTARGEPEYDGQILRWRSDGNWHYHGPGGTFDVAVRPDGTLAFRDQASIGGPSSGKPRYAPPLEDPSAPHLKPSGGVVMFTVGRFDLTDAVMRRIKQDPYGAEKRRFAEATATWRKGLRQGWRAGIRRRAVARAGLAGPLCRRYGAAGESGRRAIRRELYLQWVECREDADGRAVRDALVSAIRRCGIGYPAPELEAFNRGRRGQPRFAP